jgi:probable HAF family extracellular repeat protein
MATDRTHQNRIRQARSATRWAMVVVAVATVITGTFAWHAYAGSAAAVREKSGVTVSGINDRGQIVGTLTREWLSHGFLWKKGSLKLLGGLVEADAINERGEILGRNGNAQNVLWENGKVRKLDLGEVLALNNRGQVLGAQGTWPRGGLVGLWTNGTILVLPLSGDQPAAMNDRGQVVGVTADGDAGEWQNGKVTDLGPGSPMAINDHGEVLGSRGGDVVVWRDGTATDIGPGTPVALNERGQVIGSQEITPRILQAFLWSNGTMTDLGGGSIPTAISKSGQVIGESSRYGAFVWQNGTMTRLPEPKGHAGRPARAVAINNHNQIVGDDCLASVVLCTRNGGPKNGFAVLWTLHGRRIKTLQIVQGHS